VFLLAACGYRLSAPVTLPGKVTTIYVQPLKNLSPETGFGAVLATKVAGEIAERRGVRLAPMETAEGILSGEIKSLFREAVSRLNPQRVTERRVKVTAQFRLANARGKTLWTGEIRDSEAYPVSADRAITEKYRRDALSRMGERMAETLLARLAGAF
jgi:outer membrane lipopolysaccharide assembly protein LptE/RlpB